MMFSGHMVCKTQKNWEKKPEADDNILQAITGQQMTRDVAEDNVAGEDCVTNNS